MSFKHVWRGGAVPLAVLSLAACGGGGGGSGGNAASGGGSGSTPVLPTPTPTPSTLPPAPFGLAATAQFVMVGYQRTQVGTTLSLSQAPDKAQLAWSAEQKTYAIQLADLASGNLVYTYPGNNPFAFSIVRPDGSKSDAPVSISAATGVAAMLHWESPPGVQPAYYYGVARFGLPLAAGALPAAGTRVFPTDTSPQSALVVDFASRKVSGTVTAAYFDAWGPYNNKVQGTLQPAELKPDGSFVAAFTVPGAPTQGELRGRLMGPQGTELAVYWNGPARDGSSPAEWVSWQDVNGYAVCATCTP